jgi:hypothetical protein
MTNFQTQKSNKRLMARIIARETKREGQRKAKRGTMQRDQKNERELMRHMVRSYLTHGPSNVTCMQIMRSKGMHAKLTYNVSYSLKSLSIYKYDK